MRKFVPVRALAVVALAGCALAGTVVATSGSASAAKGPVAATCTGISGSATVAIEVSGVASSIISGCTGGHTTSQGISSTTLNPGLTSGSTTIIWLNKKTTTYDFSIATAAFTCPTFLGLTATGAETLTVTNVAGTAKVNAGGSFNACYWLGGDGTLYEASVGTVTI